VTPVHVMDGVVSLTFHAGTVYAVDSTARLYTWGGGSLLVPTPFLDGVAFAEIGPNEAFYISTEGTLYAKGENTYGQLGAWNIDSSNWVQVEW
jgi:hypothetical protein